MVVKERMVLMSRRVKLKKQFAYKHKGKRHYKHVVTIPEEVLLEVGWSSGKELEWVVSGNSLVLKSATEK